MIERIGHMIDAATGLVQARAALVICEVRKSIASAVGQLAGLIVGTLGVLILVAALSIVLAERVGWAGSLGIIGGAFLLIGASVVAALRSRGRSISETEEEARRDMQRNLELLRNAGEPPRQEAAPRAAGACASESFGSKAEGLLHDKRLLASAGFALLAILGPRRTLKSVAGLASAAGIIASAAKTWSAVKDVQSAVGKNGFAGPRHSRDGERVGSGFDY